MHKYRYSLLVLRTFSLVLLMSYQATLARADDSEANNAAPNNGAGYDMSKGMDSQTLFEVSQMKAKRNAKNNKKKHHPPKQCNTEECCNTLPMASCKGGGACAWDGVAQKCIRASWNCFNGCFFPFDGECDDGGPGSTSPWCPLGSDCGDCGSR